MVNFYPMIEIPLLCFGIVLWILCCYFAKKRREANQEEEEEGRNLRHTDSPSVYIIPVYEEEQDEEQMDIYEAYFQPPNGNPPMYCSRNLTPPPPYSLEPPSDPDQPPSYTDPPPYSEILPDLPPPPLQTPR
ncbi:ENHANCER OF AG-4 protein 2 [Chelmon rostratus]|uniref:ENHANCER OF AG-4 protein 2 n=1 Tax=Chelmon rostratus TaxID=109905 RepID=UPI001BE5CF99|nr:ENHANCER OF AG-4 protein 2 [Chelmon rostratus]